MRFYLPMGEVVMHVVVGPYDGKFFVAYLVPGTKVYQPIGETMNEAMAHQECERLNSEAKKADRKRKRGMKRRFDDWREECKRNGEKPIPEDDPVFSFADEVGLSVDFIRIAWIEFSRKNTEPEAKNYIDWRAHFRNAVRQNWFKLWFRKDNAWCLTTRGQMLEIEMKAKQTHDVRHA